MKTNPLPSQEVLHAALDYNPDTGVFTWRYRHDQNNVWNSKFSGKTAGANGTKGRAIYVNSCPYRAHRLAIVYMFGDVVSADDLVDHKNCDPYDNSIKNLRLAKHGQNGSNSRGWSKKSLPKGVSLQIKSEGYRARIGVGGKVINLGTFVTAEAAHAAYVKAAIAHKGEFARAA